MAAVAEAMLTRLRGYAGRAGHGGKLTQARSVNAAAGEIRKRGRQDNEAGGGFRDSGRWDSGRTPICKGHQG